MRRSKMRRSKTSRWSVLTGVAAFIAAFLWAYHAYLKPAWGYFGFADSQPTPGSVALVCSLAMLPAFWLPARLSRPSQFALWTVFLCVVVPSAIIPLYVNRGGIPVLKLICTVIGAFELMSIAASLPLFALPNLRLKPWVFWSLLAGLSVLLVISVFTVYGGSLQLVSILSVYEHRLQSREIEAAFAGYAVWWLGYAIDPLVMAYGLIKRKPLVFVLGALGQLFVYSTSAMRSVILLVVVLPALYVLLKGRTDRIGARIVWSAALVTVVCTFIGQIRPTAFPAAIWLFRVLGIPGLMTYDFFDFFSKHGFTYWSHVRGVSSYIPYPYDLQIPYLIGREYFGAEALSANAHFMATDGIAAAGLVGLIVIGVLAGLVLYVIDLLATRHDRLFLVMLLAGPLIALLNVGLFTTLLTDGLGLLIVFLVLMPPVRAAARVPRRVTRVPRPVLSSPQMS